jgi:hypothetical protein
MADQPSDQDKEKNEKPKIKLGLTDDLTGSSTDKSSTRKLDLSSAEKPPAPGQPGKAKKSTSKLDISDAQVPPAKSATTKIDVSATPPPKKKTSRIDPSQAVPPKKSTTRIDLSTAQPSAAKRTTTRIDSSQAAPPPGMVSGKSETSRIDLASAVPPSDVEETSDIVEGIPASLDTQKSQTMPILPVEEDTGAEDIQETTVPEATKFATQRILVDEDEGAEKPEEPETHQASPLKSVADLQEAKKRTSKVDLPVTMEEEEEGADVLKRRTMELPHPEGVGAAPPTIKIKRPDTPRTRVMPKQPVPTGEGDREAAEQEKNTTARLDLPPETSSPRPETRPKTIKIKRPDSAGGTRKPLTVSRAVDPRADEETSTGPTALDLMAAAAGQEDTGPGVWFVVLTVLGLLVTGTLIYILLGQTFALEIPFPGRL